MTIDINKLAEEAAITCEAGTYFDSVDAIATALRTAIASVESEDKAILDWLEKTGYDLRHARDEWQVVSLDKVWYGRTLREAVREAMQEATK